jgi:hypothetical protein
MRAPQPAPIVAIADGADHSNDAVVSAVLLFLLVLLLTLLLLVL